MMAVKTFGFDSKSKPHHYRHLNQTISHSKRPKHHPTQTTPSSSSVLANPLQIYSEPLARAPIIIEKFPLYATLSFFLPSRVFRYIYICTHTSQSAERRYRKRRRQTAPNVSLIVPRRPRGASVRRASNCKYRAHPRRRETEREGEVNDLPRTSVYSS